MSFELIAFSRQQHGLLQSKQSMLTPFKIGTAERKILIVFVYYVIFGVFALTSYTLAARDALKFIEEITTYFLCEAVPNPEQPCTRGYDKYSRPVITTIAIVLLGLIPVASFVFTVDTGEVKKLLMVLRRKVKTITSTEQPSTSAVSTSVQT